MTETILQNHPIADLARRLKERRSRAQHRRALRAVAMLDDHLLDDIGITRSDPGRPCLGADAVTSLESSAFSRHRRTG